MKCKNCKYKNEYSCKVFGEYVPEQYARKDDDGCICNRQQLEKIMNKKKCELKIELF